MADEPFKENPFSEISPENAGLVALAGYKGIVQALEKKENLSYSEKKLLISLRKKIAESGK